jgi:hypothetical protein
MVTFFFFSAGAWLGVLGVAAGLGVLGVLGVLCKGWSGCICGRISTDVVPAGAWLGVLGVLGVLCEGWSGRMSTGVVAALCQWISY